MNKAMILLCTTITILQGIVTGMEFSGGHVLAGVLHLVWALGAAAFATGFIIDEFARW